PSLGHVGYQELEDALALQCAGLIAGEVDAIRIETCQDPLQIKAAVNGAKRARAEAGKDIPIIVQVTVETTGTLLVGADIAAAAAARRRISPRSTRCCGASGETGRGHCRRSAIRSGSHPSPRCTARCRCARRTPTCRSANAATPTARAPSAGCRSRAIGTAA